MNSQHYLDNNVIVKHYVGSIAYGTNTPTSDVDFRGIFYSEERCIRTPFFTVKEVSDLSEDDTKLYEMTHFMKLCVDCNPNIVESLWVDDSDVIFRTDVYDFLRSCRSELLSQKIAHTTVGYAMSQLKRIKGHNKWINNPQPVEPPKQIDYISLVHNFTKNKMFKIDLREYSSGYKLIPYEQNVYGLYSIGGYSTHNDKGMLNVDYDVGIHEHVTELPLCIIKFNRNVYDEAKTKHKQYWEWKNNRNVIRSELEEKYGFDCKHAMHLIRLLRMGKEVLETGELIVKRPDAEELLGIRNGSMSYDELITYSDGLQSEINKLIKTTQLPKYPNLNRVADILMEAQDMVWNKHEK